MRTPGPSATGWRQHREQCKVGEGLDEPFVRREGDESEAARADEGSADQEEE
jgi:hypothetical protein